MAEDEKALSEVEDIASLDGVDLVALGPTDLSQTLGVHDPTDPRLRATVNEIAKRVRQIGKAKLAIPMNHAALPLGPQDLLELGVGYTHIAPSPLEILLRAMRESAQQVHRVTGRAL